MCANIYNLATFLFLTFSFWQHYISRVQLRQVNISLKIFSCFISRFPSDKSLEYNAKKEKNELMIYDTSIF